MANHKENGNNENNRQTCVTFLNREQVDYLDKLGKDYLFKYGHKLSRAKILSDLVSVAMELGIDLEKINLKCDESLCDAIARILKNENKNNAS